MVQTLRICLLRNRAFGRKSSCDREAPKVSDQLTSGKHIALLPGYEHGEFTPARGESKF
jgi:hypothetical protein